MSRVLIACEFSGEVRDAFRAMGHDAVSCDLLPTEAPGPHIQDDVLKHLDEDWDLMIAHPSCTYLALSGAGYWHRGCSKYTPAQLKRYQEEALCFVRALMAAPIHRICIENPKSIISRIRPKSQTIQPWQFGHTESKETWLWLKNLPLLVPTKIMKKPKRGYWDNQTPSGQNKIGPCPERWKLRAQTYEGIALAMAQQWGAL